MIADRRSTIRVKVMGSGDLGNLSTPKSVQKLQMALHAKAKAEAGYRFYVLYDKISREEAFWLMPSSPLTKSVVADSI